MKRSAIVFALGCLVSAHVLADTVLIRGARVHTLDAAGTLEDTDVLVRDGKIVEIGKHLSAADARIYEARGRPLTPGLFGGLTALGLETVSLEIATVDHAYTPAATTPPQPASVRPEFDVTLAYDPASVVIPVQAVAGVTFTVIAPSALPGGSLIAGQGGLVTLDGRSSEPLPGSKTLFVAMGGKAAALTGNSRAAQFMLLEQGIRETRGALFEGERLLTVAGRETLAKYLAGGRVVFHVDRAIDIHRVVTFAKKHGFKPIIAGGAEAWLVASELAAAKVPVLLNPFLNLPENFDQFGATLENAARLHQAGVTIAFTLTDDATHMARKLRQGAGIAVANGLPWDAGLAALTANPAAIFGAYDRGRIAVGLRADLVLWSGDPLEVNTLADQVWIGGEALPMVSRQTMLRDRYAPKR